MLRSPALLESEAFSLRPPDGHAALL